MCLLIIIRRKTECTDLLQSSHLSAELEKTAVKLLVITETYPHEGNLPGDMFVHVRVKKYLSSHQVKVISFASESKALTYDGVEVDLVSRPEEVLPLIQAFKPRCLIIHFFQSWMLEGLVHKLSIPIIIWVHGYEATGWYRRSFELPPLWKGFLLHCYINTRAQFTFRKLIGIANRSKQIFFVFNSKWLKAAVETDTLSSIHNCQLIPNPIDTELFAYQPKPVEQRLKALILRSFQSRKYANDLSVAAILELSKRPNFSSMQFTILGEGALFEQTLAPLRQMPNVKIEKQNLPHDLVPSYHERHGVFLCPTRQDSQGVSMCEAMSAGLVPVTSHNSAIPEFVDHGRSGILTKNVADIASALERLANEPDWFKSLSEGAAQAIRKKYAMNDVIRKELELIESLG